MVEVFVCPRDLVGFVVSAVVPPKRNGKQEARLRPSEELRYPAVE